MNILRLCLVPLHEMEEEKNTYKFCVECLSCSCVERIKMLAENCFNVDTAFYWKTNSEDFLNDALSFLDNLFRLF